MEQKYRIALVLASDNYVNLSSPSNLFNAKRAFRIFRWDDKVTYHDRRTDKESLSDGWVPWLFYDGTKWHKITESKKYWKHLESIRTVMMRAHLFFTDEKEFKEWVGQEIFNKIVLDLL